MNTFNPLAPRRFGIELEVSRRLTCINHADKSYSQQWNELNDVIRTMIDNRKIGSWKVKVDTSCGGEVVSPILTGVNGLKEVALVCDRVKQIAKKYGLPAVDGECGLHVHVDVADFKPSQLSNLAMLVFLAEPIIYSMYPNRNHEYCAPIDMNMRLASKWRDWIDVRDTWYRSSNNVKDKGVHYDDRFINTNNGSNHNHYDGTRYHGFNIHCYWRQNTVEFRYAAGTLDPLHVRAYYEMCLAMVNTAAESKRIVVDESLLNMKYPTLRQHYTGAWRFRKMLVEVAKRCNWSRSTMRLILSLVGKYSPVLLMKDPARTRLVINTTNAHKYWYYDTDRNMYFDDKGVKWAMTGEKLSSKAIINITIGNSPGGKFHMVPANKNVTFAHTIFVDINAKPKPIDNPAMGIFAVGDAVVQTPVNAVADQGFFTNFQNNVITNG